jgi:FtsH-binding integral membrane protein
VSTEVVRPVRGIGTAATVSIAVSAGIEVIIAVMAWISVDPASSTAVDLISVYVQFVAAVLFIAWMHRARLNSDVITSRHQHRYTNVWVVVGWIVPLANLFIPYAVMQDIWRGSDRTQPMVGLQKRPQSGLVTAWWITYIGSNVLGVVAGQSALDDVPALYTICAAGFVAAAVLAARMIKQVNEMQEVVEVHVGES